MEKINAVKGKESAISRDRTLANSKLLCCGLAHCVRRVAVLQMTTV